MSAPKKVLVAGGGGFIGSHLAKRLKSEGNWVRVADWQENQYFKKDEFCNEFALLDLRTLENCLKACDGVEEVYNLAADMGGMGFIQVYTLHTVLLIARILFILPSLIILQSCTTTL
jgi:nucleoside-diphosphate-sugar epimerase